MTFVLQMQGLEQTTLSLKVKLKFHLTEFKLFINVFLIGNVAEWRKMMDVNVIALNQCTQLSIKSMLKV